MLRNPRSRKKAYPLFIILHENLNRQRLNCLGYKIKHNQKA